MADSLGRWHHGISAAHPMGSKLKPNNDSFVDHWASSSVLWGARHCVAETIDRYMGLHVPAVSSTEIVRRQALGLDTFEMPKQSSLSYSNILKLDGETVKWKELSWKRLQAQIKDNTNEFRQALKPSNIKHFFHDVSFKDYAKYTMTALE
jgi:hypothetical protein